MITYMVWCGTPIYSMLFGSWNNWIIKKWEWLGLNYHELYSQNMSTKYYYLYQISILIAKYRVKKLNLWTFKNSIIIGLPLKYRDVEILNINNWKGFWIVIQLWNVITCFRTKLPHVERAIWVSITF
jgi:hypothetical protein